MQSIQNFYYQPARVCVRVSRVVLIFIPLASLAQQAPSQPEQQTPSQAEQQSSSKTESCAFRSLGRCAGRVAKEQQAIFTAPLRVQKRDFLWLAPLAVTAGTTLAFDRETVEQVSTDPSRVNNFRSASNWTGIYVPVAFAGTALLAGTMRHDDHLRETGLLAMRAMADTQLLTAFLKFGTARARPQANGAGSEDGTFWPDGKHASTADSFPSGHTANAFAVAHVIANEYPGWKVKLVVYGLAAATGFERVAGREHFPTDVLVGGAIGYLVGGYVFDHHSSRSKTHVSVAPMLGHGGAGVSVQISRSAN
jgi:hypothetical protein